MINYDDELRWLIMMIMMISYQLTRQLSDYYQTQWISKISVTNRFS